MLRRDPVQHVSSLYQCRCQLTTKGSLHTTCSIHQDSLQQFILNCISILLYHFSTHMWKNMFWQALKPRSTVNTALFSQVDIYAEIYVAAAYNTEFNVVFRILQPCKTCTAELSKFDILETALTHQTCTSFILRDGLKILCPYILFAL